ncbi:MULTISPECIES: ATP-binding protein [Streptosporangium]|uniref:Anti-sigma regulatory factor (Ser/Thr protein kinase) n=1 Tax=Streptosporangium brasiliense TaxID=47480 RepID=A0ABT9R528_9ACTN|nr:ATP-binding protein [Streptosporangium brasiliense]MDP9863914.1 anti-sigma regulatory factor (Ser/Thr protein kinase) [Streptosporangium brasiliense]
MTRESVYAAFEAMVKRWAGLRVLGQRSFYGVPQSAGRARKWVVGVLSAHASTEVLETVELLVSEVVTNAILHSDAGPDEVITVRVGLRDDLLLIEVIDGGSVFNVPAMRPADDGLSGRGLTWVNSLSSGWGTDYDPDIGRAVWFHLAAG